METETIKNIIIGLSLMWLIPQSIIVTDLIIYNIKIGKIEDRKINK